MYEISRACVSLQKNVSPMSISELPRASCGTPLLSRLNQDSPLLLASSKATPPRSQCPNFFSSLQCSVCKKQSLGDLLAMDLGVAWPCTPLHKKPGEDSGTHATGQRGPAELGYRFREEMIESSRAYLGQQISGTSTENINISGNAKLPVSFHGRVIPL